MYQAMAYSGAEVLPGIEVLTLHETAFHKQSASGLQHPVKFAEVGSRIIKVLYHLNHIYSVDTAIADIFELQFRVLVDVQALNTLRREESSVFALTTPKVHDLL